jgi:glutathione S-transferase
MRRPETASRWRLLLALLGREYERVPVDIFAGDTLTDAYAAINPPNARRGAGVSIY